MSTNYENGNPQYIFKYQDCSFSDVITYKNNLVDEIKFDQHSKNIEALQNFSSKKVTDGKFKEFIQMAKDAGYHIYKVEKL